MPEVIYGGRHCRHRMRARSRCTVIAAPTPSAVGHPILARRAKIYCRRCADCHQTDDRGVADVYLALADSPAVRATDPIDLVCIVLDGDLLPATAANSRPYGMPPYFGRLSDAQIAAVWVYIRVPLGATRHRRWTRLRSHASASAHP
jgi:mono/diheme cytochrome c family protein